MPLLHRLSLAQKFLVLGAIALVMVAVPLGLYFQKTLAEIDVLNREQSSTKAVFALNKVVQFTQ